ncbi:MAG TPA: methyltransferase domain-containing protein [Gemmataceae bacterium]|nr:methyltransferase domain-containing protein [Gemmataceae bacterium]
MATPGPATDWQQETLFYDKVHPRMVAMARCVRAMPHRSVLDIGCSTGIMRRLLPGDCDYYGCDITDHAGARLPPGHFRQIDLNANHDLSYFASRGIRLAHMAGVLVYLNRPGEVLVEIHRLVGLGGHLVCSIVNFQATRRLDPTTHHPAWVYKPHLEDLRRLLADRGWRVTRELPFVGGLGWRTGPYRLAARLRGVDHPWTRAQANLFILVAEAV